MKSLKSLLIVSTLFAATTGGLLVVQSGTAQAAYLAYRQYYGSWSYYPQRTYYYRSYYYKPYTTYTTYRYHYVIYYPSRPRYTYYYNPYRKVYWGRYDLEAKGYSMLAEKDQKGKLEDIPESAFPEPSKMPPIPESEDEVAMEPIAKDDLPKAEPPEDAPSN